MQIGAGLLVLLLGTLVYVMDRPSGSAPFFSIVNATHLLPSLFGRIGDSLPTFAHVFAFSLATTVCLGGGRRTGRMACVAWFGIDTAFEVGQHSLIANYLVLLIPRWFERLPILEHADAYFASGTFDAWDLVSIAAGASAAYLITLLPTSEDRSHE